MPLASLFLLSLLYIYLSLSRLIDRKSLGVSIHPTQGVCVCVGEGVLVIVEEKLKLIIVE